MKDQSPIDSRTHVLLALRPGSRSGSLLLHVPTLFTASLKSSQARNGLTLMAGTHFGEREGKQLCN